MSEALSPYAGQEVLTLYRGLVRIPGSRPTMRQLAQQVADEHGLTLDDLTGPSRTDTIVRARQEAMAVIRANTRFSFPQIGRFFNRDHTTVIYSVRAYEARQDRVRFDRRCLKARAA